MVQKPRRLGVRSQRALGLRHPFVLGPAPRLFPAPGSPWPWRRSGKRPGCCQDGCLGVSEREASPRARASCLGSQNRGRDDSWGSGRGLPGLPAAGTGCGPWADVFTECLRQEVPAAGSRRLWPGRASGGSEGRDVTRPRPVGGAGRTPGSRRSLPGQLSARTCGPPPAALCLNLVGTICTWFSLLNSVDFSEPSATCGPRRSPRRGAAALLTPQPCL
ncbi:unnamed protein product [Rangifer tarandus platyrhynchus]|uniref:Uncharacterized protein n=1 Tax=Rangifer tarandus platyrhynchus TaxID=3082113 RepID=A0AC59ZB74_RANTA